MPLSSQNLKKTNSFSIRVFERLIIYFIIILDEPGYGPDDYEYLIHNCTKDQNETYDVVYDWRAVLDQYAAKDNESKLMMTEAYTDIEHIMRYYGNATRNGSIPFNFVFLGELDANSTAVDIQATINKWMQAMPVGKVANWVVSIVNHFQW